MTVGSVAAIAGLLAGAAACEKAAQRRDEPAPVTAPRDARAAPSGDASLADLLDGLEPVDPAPPPIVRKHRQGDCRPEYAPRPNRDPNPMCKVDGGTFELGEPAAKAAGTPQRTTVKSFYIDQFEVTAAQAARFLNAQGHNECYGPDAKYLRVCVGDVDGGRLDLIRKKERYVAHPDSETRAASFTIEGALRYCAWVGKRVPSEAYWEYAGRHDPKTNRDYAYAWGDEWHADRAYIPDENNGPFLPGSTMPVGSFDGSAGRPDGSSPWGLHDVVGNSDEIAVRCVGSNDGCGLGCKCTVVERGNAIPGKDLTWRSVESDPSDTGGVTGLRCVRPAP